MAVKLLEGLHLTARDRQVLQHMHDNAMPSAHTKAAQFTLTRLEEGGWRYTMSKKETDMWGRQQVRASSGVVSITEGKPE